MNRWAGACGGAWRVGKPSKQRRQPVQRAAVEQDMISDQVAPTKPMPCSRLHELTRPRSFIWATGIEDTFITDPHRVSKRHLDEYELTGHYRRWREDLDLIASLGVTAARYGIPWHLVQPEKDRWDWTWADQTLGYLLDQGVHPIVDLMHYGVPAWLEGSLLDPDYPPRMAEYAARLAERFKGRVHWYTPLNEPRINAWYCGKLGWWPPYRRGWTGFAAVLTQLARGIVLTQKALKEIDPEIVTVHVDATDVYTPTHPDVEAEAAFRQRLVFLPLDLVTGRVGDDPDTGDWLSSNGIPDRAIEWFVHNNVEPDVIGINLYPMFSDKRMSPSPTGGRVRIQQSYAGGSLVERLGRMYFGRYHKPLMITETASAGSSSRRVRWLRDSVASVRSLRESGIPLVGYTWWPLFSLVAWGYRQGKRPMSEYLLDMGLWDLDANLDRVETPAAEEFRRHARSGADMVGVLARGVTGEVYAL